MLKRITIFSLVATVVAGLTGCSTVKQSSTYVKDNFSLAGTEKKMGRGLNNVTEIFRMGELRREMEQTALFEGADVAYTTGFIRGFNRTIVRTGLGIYEICTAPFPAYEPTMRPYATGKYSANPVYPDSYKPGLIEDSTVAPDTSLGFAGGDVAPFFPGSRFRIFDN